MSAWRARGGRARTGPSDDVSTSRPSFAGRLSLALVISLITLLAPLPLHSQQADAERLWTILQSATVERSRIGPGLAEVRGMRPPEALPGADPLLDAYEGAFLAMSATTTAWPPSKLSRALDGLSLLDRAVAAAPTDPTVRYLRLIICHHVPSLFRRGDTARRDAVALAGMLLRPPETNPDGGRELEMAKFLLSTGYLDVSIQAAVRSRFPRA